MPQPSDAYMEGVIAAEAGKPREVINPWNLKWIDEWLRGYDEASEWIEENSSK